MQVIGFLLILAGIPLTLLTCVPGLICMGVGCLFIMAGKSPVAPGAILANDPRIGVVRAGRVARTPLVFSCPPHARMGMAPGAGGGRPPL